MALSWFPNTYNQYVKFLFTQAEDIFTVNGEDSRWWRITLSIAEALMIEKTLDNKRINEILHEAVPKEALKNQTLLGKISTQF